MWMYVTALYMPLALKEVHIVTLKLINEGMQKAQHWLILHWFILLFIYYFFFWKANVSPIIFLRISKRSAHQSLILNDLSFVYPPIITIHAGVQSEFITPSKYTIF